MNANQRRHFGRFALVLVAVAAIASAVASTAAADPKDFAWGNDGFFRPNAAKCLSDGIHIAGPVIYPSNTGLGFMQNSQWTGFRAVLERWDQTTRSWVDVYTSEPYAHLADWMATEPEYFYYQHPEFGVLSTTQAQTIPMARWDGTRWVPLPGRVGYFRYSLIVSWKDANYAIIGRARKANTYSEYYDERGVDLIAAWSGQTYCNYTYK
jgi:hypothetical protein